MNGREPVFPKPGENEEPDEDDDWTTYADDPGSQQWNRQRHQTSDQTWARGSGSRDWWDSSNSGGYYNHQHQHRPLGDESDLIDHSFTVFSSTGGSSSGKSGKRYTIDVLIAELKSPDSEDSESCSPQPPTQVERDSISPSTEEFLNVTPGCSLVDTAAQSATVGAKAFRKHEELLWTKYGLRCKLKMEPTRATGVGGKAQVLSKVTIPVGMGQTNGTLDYTVIGNDSVPPLTPVNTLHNLGAVVDLPEGKMTYKRIGKEQCLTQLPSGHVEHSIVDFAPGGWKLPNGLKDESFYVPKGQAYTPLKFVAPPVST